MLNNKHEKVILKRNLCTNLSQKLTEILQTCTGHCIVTVSRFIENLFLTDTSTFVQFYHQ